METAPFEEEKLALPEQKFFHVSKTPTHRGRKRRFPGSIPLRMVWKPQPHGLTAKRQPGVLGTSATRGGQDPIPGSTNRGRNRWPPGSIPPRTVWKPQSDIRRKSHPRIRNPSIHLQPQQTGVKNGGPPGSMPSRTCGNPNLGFVKPASPGEDNIPYPDHNPYIFNSYKPGTKTVVPWVDTAPHGVETPVRTASATWGR